DRQLLDAVAVGQVTPGPVFTTATFIGFLLAGWTGAVLATVAIFLPSFVFVAASRPLLPRLRGSRRTAAFLDGVNVAALGLMAAVTWELGRAAIVDALTAALALVAIVLLVTTRVNSVWLLAAAGAAFKLGAPTTIDAVLQGRGELKALPRLVERAAGRPNLVLAEDTVKFGPCVTNPEKIICVGLNYRKHAAETGNPVPKTPILFNKYNNALAGHKSVIRVSEEPTEKVDYEVELVIVIGRVARNVSEADALSSVFGYCVGNDLSARDLQQ